MSSMACFCGAEFATVEALHTHAISLGHRFACGCGTVVADRDALSNHKNDAKHIPSANCDRYLDLEEPHTDPRKCGICKNRPAFKDQSARDHHVEDKHKACPVCTQVFDSTVDRLRHQKAANHCYCEEHNEAFNRPEDFADHKHSHFHTSSFECTECQRSFTSEKALDHHWVSEGHKKVIDEAAAKEAESQAAAIKLARREEANLRCESCNRSFKHLRAFRQHKESLKHKPLSELKCPISSKCLGTFNSPSALLFHLESGGCRGGMTHNKLNAIVYQHDTDRHITSDTHAHQILTKARSEASHISVSPGSSASNRARSVSVDSSSTGTAGPNAATPSSSETDYDVRSLSEDSSVLNGGAVVFTPPDSTADSDTATPNNSEIDYDVRSISDTSSVVSGGGVILTSSASTTSTARTVHSPSASVVSSDGSIILTPPASVTSSAALSDWSFLNTTNILTPATTSLDGSSVSTVTFDTALNRWPCPSCPQTFRRKHDLIQHMNSVVHAAKVFHCPTDLPGLDTKPSKPTIHFKTLSGLAQHVEAGSCKGGKATLGFIVGIFEKQIQAKMGKSVKLLKD